MGNETVYLYESQSRAAIGPYLPQASPMEPGKFITPDSSTSIPIPHFNPDRQTCIFREEEERWHVTDIPVVVPPPPAPATPHDLGELKNNRVAMLMIECQEKIHSGFLSAALGVPHLYPAKDRDQQNLAAAVAEAMRPNLAKDWISPLWCADGNGKWDFIDHTAAQVQSAGADANATRIAAMRKLKNLGDQINAIEINATTTEDAAKAAVQAITWAALMADPSN